MGSGKWEVGSGQSTFGEGGAGHGEMRRGGVDLVLALPDGRAAYEGTGGKRGHRRFEFEDGDAAVSHDEG